MNPRIQTAEMSDSKVALCRNLTATVATTEQRYNLSNSSTKPPEGRIKEVGMMCTS